MRTRSLLCCFAPRLAARGPGQAFAAAIALSNLALMYYFVPPTRTLLIDAEYHILSHRVFTGGPYLLHGSAAESAALRCSSSTHATA